MPQLGAFISGIGAFLSAGTVATGVTAFSIGTQVASTLFGGSILSRLLVSVALSALSRALLAKPGRQRAGGISTEVTTTGEDVSRSFVIGKYATEGHHVCPPMWSNQNSGIPNGWLTYVIDVSDVPNVSLDSLIINDEYVNFSGTDSDGMQLATGKYLNSVKMKFYDGTQTVADAYLINNFANGTTFANTTDRPWNSDMIGIGVAYIIVSFLYKRDLFNALPRVRAVINGIPLYDPRKDSTVGGSGLHRWGVPSTYEPTANNFVMIYNIMRGITLPDGRVYGGEYDAEDLPNGTFFAAMNECDVQLVTNEFGTVTQFEAGYEIKVSEDEPYAVIDELLKACSGSLAESGGVWNARVGSPGSPIYYFDESDIVTDYTESLTMFPGLESAYNAIQATYPDPSVLWETKGSPLISFPVFQAEDQDRQLVAELSLPVVFHPGQVQRLCNAYIKDNRRSITHAVALPPDALALEPLDIVAFTSSKDGYSDKDFEVISCDLMPKSLTQLVLLREVDPTDYDYDPNSDIAITYPTIGTNVPPVLSPTGFTAVGASVLDDANAARMPAIYVTWDSISISGIDAVVYEMRRVVPGAQSFSAAFDDSFANSNVVQSFTGYFSNTAAGEGYITGNIIPNTNYEVRISFLAPGLPTQWTGWLPVTTPNVLLSVDDMDAEVIAYLTGLLDIARFAQTIRPVEILPTLPGTGDGNFVGRLVLLTSDYKLYRNTTGSDDTSGWTRAVDGSDILANSIGVGVLQAGVIRATEIAANAVTLNKLAVTDLSKVFSSSFEDYSEFLSDWEFMSGFTETNVVASSLVRGGNALQVGDNSGNDGLWLVHKRLVPFDPNKMYRWDFRGFRAAGVGEAFIGFIGYALDGVTRVHPTNGSTNLEGHWHGLSNSPLSGAFAQYEGYTFGYGGAAGTAGVGTRTSPGLVHPNVRYMRPAIRLNSNLNTQPGTSFVDYLDLDALVTGVLITPEGITAENLATSNLITLSAQINDAIITTAKIANLAVTNAKIADLAVTNAKIGNLAVTTAKIGNLAVDTLQVANSAISTLSSVFTAGTVSISSSPTTVQTLVVNKGRTDPLPIWMRLNLALVPPGNSDGSVTIEVKRSGTVVYSRTFTRQSDNWLTPPVGYYEFVDTTTSTGSFTYTIDITTSSLSMEVSDRLLAVLNILK